MKGFDLNSPLTPMIIGASSKVSSKSVPNNKLISFKLALEYMYLNALNLSVRSEIKYMPLKLTILGDSLCAATLFIFENPKKSMLQSSIYNVSQDLMTKILQLLPKAFINLSFVSSELNSADLNSKIDKNSIKTLNSSAWRKGSVLNFNTLTSLVVFFSRFN